MGASRYEQELKSLLNLSRILAPHLDQESVLKTTLDLLHDELRYQRGLILLVSSDHEGLILEVAQDSTAYSHGTLTYRKGEGIVGQVLKTGQPIAVPKVSEEPLFLDRIYDRKKNCHEELCFFCVPIHCEKEILGILSADISYENGLSLEHHIQFLQTVANLIAYDVKSRRETTVQVEYFQCENSRLNRELKGYFRPTNIIGSSPAIREVYRSIQQVAGSKTTVLIRGESGTGKELVAQAIHDAGGDTKRPFVKVNCAALNENLLESELFGHEKGAFTGAVAQRKGRIEEADGGTLFLDEIGDFSPLVQVKLLRVLQEKIFERVGSNTAKKANIRLLCATNRDLEEGIRNGTFREDFYYRINVFPIVIPPLRDRREDLILLANHFVELYSNKAKKRLEKIANSAVDLLLRHSWPGNVRELENVMERAVLVAQEEMICGHDLPPYFRTGKESAPASDLNFEDRIAAFERDIILESLQKTRGNMAAAAMYLGTTPRIIRYKIKQLGIQHRCEH